MFGTRLFLRFVPVLCVPVGLVVVHHAVLDLIIYNAVGDVEAILKSQNADAVSQIESVVDDAVELVDLGFFGMLPPVHVSQ